MRPDLVLDGRALYDFGFALVGDQEEAEALALQNTCVASADHADNHGRLLCSLRRLWQQVSRTGSAEFRSTRPQDDFLRILTLEERAAVAGRFLLHLTLADLSAVFDKSVTEEAKVLGSAVQRISELSKEKTQ